MSAQIMETELGKQVLGDERCTGCIANDRECWIYSRVGAAQVSFPGDAVPVAESPLILVGAAC